MTHDSALDARNRNGDSGRNLAETGNREFRGSARGNFRGEIARPLAFGLTTDNWHETSSAAMRSHVGDDRHAAKRLGKILECSPRTAENFLLGRTAPSGIHFLRAYAMIPEFTAEVRRLTGKSASQDPTFERDLAEFLVKASQHLDQRSAP